jgi:hypothetical protein
MMLGEVGRQMLYFYEANSCAINSVVLTYGVIMFAAWTNLVRTYRYLIMETAKKVHLSEDLNRKATKKKVLDSIEIPWEEAVEHSPLPLVARMGALLPKRKSVESLKIYFDENDLVDKAIRALKGEDIRRMSPTYRELLDRERAHKKENTEKK